MGYFCVDNLPARARRAAARPRVTATRVGIILDVRNPDFAARFPEILGRLRAQVPGRGCSSSTPRRSPSSADSPKRAGRIRSRATGPLLEALRRERQMLEEVRSVADVVVDTSEMTVHELRSFIQKTFVGDPDGRGWSSRRPPSATSSGCRTTSTCSSTCASSRTRISYRSSRARPGSDPAVAAYIEKDPETGAFLQKLSEFFDYLLPLYEREHKSYLSIGIGCTGGKHRSVYVAERLAELLKERGLSRPRLAPRRHARQ